MMYIIHNIQTNMFHLIIHLFSFCEYIQDYKIHMDMEIVKFTEEV